MTDPNVQMLLELACRCEQTGRFADAEAICRQVLAVEPDSALANNILGMAAFRTARHDLALDCFRRAVERAPTVPEYHNNLGSALKAMGRHAEAAACFRRAVELRADYVTGWYNLSLALLAAGHCAEAAGAARTAVRIAPTDAGAWKQLSIAAQKAGSTAEAIDSAAAAARLAPGDADVHLVLGSALQLGGRFADAATAFRKAIELRPNLAEAYNNLGNALQSAGLLDDAIAAYRRAVDMSDDATAHGNLGNVLAAVGLIDSAIEHYRLAVRRRPQDPVVHSNLLLTLHYRHGWDAPMLREEHAAWARAHAEPFSTASETVRLRRRDGGPLRIGYVSPDLCMHPVGLFMRPILEGHDRARVTVYCYADVVRPDHLTAELRQHADVWRDVAGLDDAALARLISEDGIDIAVDLAGHTARNRLLALARRPAPVQITYLGYPNTTGMSAMGWRITDAFCDPPGATDAFHVERLLRLPTCLVCFRPPPEAPPVSERPAERSGAVVFGCFNNLAKLSPQALRLWARIMRAVPQSRLVLKARGLSSAVARQYVLEHLPGIDAHRVRMLPHTPTYAEHLAAYAEMDIALDSFPYCGTTTTCEALWMGVPVVSLAGPVHVGRVGLSLLTAAGLPQLAAGSEEEYAEKAIALARERGGGLLARSALREKVASSALCDGKRFVAELQEAFERAWRSS